MELGPIQQSVTTSAMALRGKAPTKFTGGPELRYGLQLYQDAFFDLSGERNMGFGHGPIPWHSIVAYATYYEFTEEQSDRLIIHIRAMDSAFIKKMNDDAEAKRK